MLRPVTRGPQKQFDPDRALTQARDLFWRRGFDGTTVGDLEAELGIGRKSLYDTFGNKRELYLRSLEHYGATVIAAITGGLGRAGQSPRENLERVLLRLADHHGSGESRGCLLGVGLGQVDRADAELADVLRRWLGRLEDGFERAVGAAQAAGELRGDLPACDVARQLVALVQGLALLGRVADSPASGRAVVRATLAGLAP
jgi:TetR/AcrR family transcriptional repressor of nem operon